MKVLIIFLISVYSVNTVAGADFDIKKKERLAAIRDKRKDTERKYEACINTCATTCTRK